MDHPAGWMCPECGYDLRMLTSACCPECGFALDTFRTQEPQIPWVHRRDRGWLRTYWQTVWLASVKSRQFCLEIVRPVSYPDARRFHWVTLIHAWLPVLIGGLVVFLQETSESGATDLEWWGLLSVFAVTLLGLIVLTGMSTYAFHPRQLPAEQQNRAIALSYYSWAPLSLIPLALPIFLVLVFTEPRGWARWFMEAPIVVLIAGPFLLAFVKNVHFTRVLLTQRGIPSHWGRLLLLALLTGAGLLAVLILPVIVLYILIIFYSLR